MHFSDATSPMLSNPRFGLGRFVCFGLRISGASKSRALDGITDLHLKPEGAKCCFVARRWFFWKSSEPGLLATLVFFGQ